MADSVHLQKIKTASGDKLHLRSSYSIENSITPYFTPKARSLGGSITATRDAKYITCPYKDGFTVVSTIDSKVLKHYEAIDDTLLCTCMNENGDSIELSGVELFTGWQSSLIRQYSLETESLIRGWKCPGSSVLSLDYSRSASMLASTHSDHQLRVWEINNNNSNNNNNNNNNNNSSNNKQCRQIGHQIQLGSLSHRVKWHTHPAWSLMFTWGSGRDIAVWKLASSGKTSSLGKLQGHLNLVSDICFHPESPEVVYTSSRDGVIIQWRISKNNSNHTNTRLLSLQQSLDAICITTPKCEQTSPLIFTASFRGELFTIDTTEWKRKSTLLPYGRMHDDTNSANNKPQDVPASLTTSQLICCTSGSNNTILAVNHDNNITIINSDSLVIENTLVGANDEILSLCVLPNLNALAVATNSEQIRIYKVNLQEKSDCVFGQVQLLENHKDMILCIDYMQDGKVLVSASKDKTILVWKFIDNIWKCAAIGKGHTQNVSSVACSKLGGEFVISAGHDCTLKMWDLSEIFLEKKSEKLVKLSSIWTRVGHDKDINALDIAPNDKLIASASHDKTAKIWDSSSGDEIGELKGHRKVVWCVRFSPVDQCVATCSADMTVKVWNLTDFACIRTFEGHISAILQVAFITHGVQLISCSSEGVLKVWSIKSNDCTLTLDVHTDRIWSVSVINDGEYILTGSSDSKINLIKDTTVEQFEKKVEEEELLLLRMQELNNYLEAHDFQQAIKLALDMPGKLLFILNQVLESENSELSLIDTIVNMTSSELSQLLGHIVRWNTNSKYSFIAQNVLNVILQQIPKEQLMALDQIPNYLSSLLPYSQRHLNRMNKLLQQASILQYTWQLMKMSEI